MLIELGIVPIIFVFLSIGVFVLLLFQAFASPADANLFLFLRLGSFFSPTLVGLLVDTKSKLVPLVSQVFATRRIGMLLR